MHTQSERDGYHGRSYTVQSRKVKHSGTQIKMGKVILLESRRGKASPAYSRSNHRIREIETIIRSRHGGPVPHTDDADAYVQAVAYAYVAINPKKAQRAISSWCATWAPWAMEDGTIEAALADTEGRKRDLSQYAVAKLLAVRWAERQRLKLRTIAAFDIPRKEQKALAKQKKRETDRERARLKRARSGAKSRQEYEAQSINKAKPWEDEGISRRTWYRRQKQHGTSPSLIGYITKRDTPVPNTSKST